MKSRLVSFLEDLCGISSPTYNEQDLVAFVKKSLSGLEGIRILEYSDGLLVDFPKKYSKKYSKKGSKKHPNKPHLSLIGHGDVVCPYFKPFWKGNRFYGAGASDMKAAVAVFMDLITTYATHSNNAYCLSFVLYSREEGTAIQENGLYSLISRYRSYFKSIDLGLVGEPTNNTLQIGCLGSLHLRLIFPGIAAHSARPWDGKNALYEAAPFLNKIAKLKPKKYVISGVDYYEVITITESHSASGITTVPDYWMANINYRYAPNKTLKQAQSYLKQTLINMGANPKNIHYRSMSYAGSVIQNSHYKSFITQIDKPIEAKQAWTDVAQLSRLGVASLNYGPGKTQQAHKPNEYVLLSDIERYAHSLRRIFFL